MNRREFLAASAASAALLNQGVRAFAAPAGNIQVAVDATKIGAPITPLIFGGYMEPATTGVWAEMLTDRKFANPVTENPPPVRSFMIPRGQSGDPFKPVGPAGTVEMDTVRPFVGRHSPRVKLDGSEPRGIQQSKLRLRGGRSYEGRVYLAGDPGAKVVVRLVWGTGADDSHTITIPPLEQEYRRFSLHFTPAADTENGRLEIVGAGNGSFHIGTVSLMPADNIEGFHAGMIRLYKEAGFKMAKWPGGNFVSAYDWYDGIGDRDKRPPRPQPMWGNAIESNDMGIHEFVAFCRLLGATPDLAVNTGFGEARVAAEEVEYCNGSTNTRLGRLRAENGHPEPFNIRMWCIGNEMYGPWQFGHMSLDQYWVKHNYFVEAMRKVDPGIKVTVAGAILCDKSLEGGERKVGYIAGKWYPPVTTTIPYEFGSLHDWDGWLLEKCRGNIDYISCHNYTFTDEGYDAKTQHFVNYADAPVQLKARRMSNRIGMTFDTWQRYVERMPWLKETDIKFIFDEWGVRGMSSERKRIHVPGVVSMFSYVLYFHELFRHSDMVDATCPTGGLGTVLIDHTGETVGFTNDGLAIKIMANHFSNALPVAVSGDSPQQATQGTPFVDIPVSPIGSPTYPLDVVAALSSDRKTFILSVANPTEDGQEFTPQISGVKLRSTGKLWQIAAPNVDAENEPGKEPVVKINEIPQTSLPESVHVPPLSVSIYEYEIEA